MLPLLLGLLAGCTCAAPPHRSFDIPPQPAAAGLNEFARQADITLIFSYDLVDDVQTRALHGRYTATAGLNELLSDTGLGYQEVEHGTFSICRGSACGLDTDPSRARQ